MTANCKEIGTYLSQQALNVCVLNRLLSIEVLMVPIRIV